MARRSTDFREEDKIKVLLWCARHCCLCEKAVGVGIEVAHLDPKRSDLDNAIPLCFDCHAAVGHYNAKHARRRKYSIPELKARRDQVYEHHTRHLVSPVRYRVFQEGTELPTVRFSLHNLGDTYPVRARVVISLSQGDRSGCPQTAGHYDGRLLWNLNPRSAVVGHFDVPESVLQNGTDWLKARVDLTVIDLYDREHTLLPGGYVYTLQPGEEWYFEPAEEIFGPPSAGR